MADISLSAASRNNLLSLQRTQEFVDRTQTRLSTGKAVSSVIDDAVKYFQAKSLSDRASDLSARKDAIDQGVSSLKTVLEATDKMEKLTQQMKGILNSARSATDTQRKEFTKQLGQLVYQVQKLVEDTSYQGANLLNSSSSTLNIVFSDKADSKLTVNGVNFNASAYFQNSQGTAAVGLKAATDVDVVSGVLLSKIGISKGSLSEYTLSVAAILASFNKNVDLAITRLDKTIDNLRSKASVFGQAVAILQVRLDFTKNYTNLLTEGSDKLTLANLNEEGANLLALQTRQQLGIQALSFAGQSEQGIMRLFS